MYCENPSVRVATNSRSYNFSLTTTCAIALKSAVSVPGCWRSHRSAWRVISVWRGSTTISVAPFWWTACLRKVAMTGWVSAVLLPMTMKHSRCSISAMELLIALEPMASCRPETLPAWQSRAQWSMLLVPMIWRRNFCSR